jgi:NSS family neurotransmitter:Na+ symporter
VVVGLAWILGLLTVMSFGGWGFEFEFAGAKKTDGIFDILDIVTTNFLLPLGGLAIALFAGWVMASGDTADELGVGEQTGGYRLWRVLVRFVAPAGVILFFLHSLGVW